MKSFEMSVYYVFKSCQERLGQIQSKTFLLLSEEASYDDNLLAQKTSVVFMFYALVSDYVSKIVDFKLERNGNVAKLLGKIFMST